MAPQNIRDTHSIEQIRWSKGCRLLSAHPQGEEGGQENSFFLAGGGNATTAELRVAVQRLWSLPSRGWAGYGDESVLVSRPAPGPASHRTG